ncbi:hypothetical protein J5H75_26750 [Pseudomonas asiatica]|uniref:hypothetical protein n=1 Tax=Pseudomonas asiatica TaxID=2219225 RepID=UPI001AAED25C|nr:hypothetical protein [Pseudomonas asiatica]MBO2925276.1 hypothetical protein [Pseudomonas asiatica]
MEVAASQTPQIHQAKTSLLLWATALTTASTVLVFIASIGKDYGMSGVSSIMGEPVVFQSYIFQALGGSLGLPAIHVLAASLFKSKRNSTSRRRIFIVWSVVVSALQLIIIKSL